MSDHPTPILAERCSCNALLEVGPTVDWDVAIAAAKEWRAAHRHSLPYPARPAVDVAGSASLEPADNLGCSATVGFQRRLGGDS